MNHYWHRSRTGILIAALPPFHALASPIVVPIQRRKLYGVVVQLVGKWRGSNQKVGAEQKLVSGIEIERMLVGRSLRKFEEQRSQNGQAGARHLLYRRIEIRHQPVAFFDIASTDIFLLRSVHPGFALSCAFLAVIAIDGLEGGQLSPLGKQF